MKFTHYKGRYIARHQDLPGIKRFCSYFGIYGLGVAPVDRTGTLKLPVRIKSLFPIPKMRTFTKSYEELCNKRAQELLDRAARLDVPLYAFWSGGIDSTCLLVSLLKVATKPQLEQLVVLMSEDSIAEYPSFYRRYIRGRLRRESANMFPYILGTKNLIVNGEHNDQLFGSDIIASANNRFGPEAVRGAYDRNLFVTLFAEALQGDSETALFYAALFERLAEAAPVPLKTNFDRFWWINFALKWQTVYMRMLNFTAKRTAENLSEEYLKKYYAPFYNTKDFQLWSMNNLEQRIQEGWRSYKWPAKEVIYGVTKDADYRDNKLKRGSLQYLVVQHPPANFIDENFRFHENVKPEEFFEPENDFR